MKKQEEGGSRSNVGMGTLPGDLKECHKDDGPGEEMVHGTPSLDPSLPGKGGSLWELSLCACGPGSIVISPA